MSEFLSEKELQRLDPAETCAFESPVPTQPISNGEFFPGHQSKEQKQVQDLVREYGDSIANRIGMGRRQFLKTAAGMAVAFLAMTQHQLGQREEAIKSLATAEAWFAKHATQMPTPAEATPQSRDKKPGDMVIPLTLSDWLEAHVLRREAEKLIKGTLTTAKN